MTLLRVGLRLGRRRAVIGVAIFAALLCGLGSTIMQELAHSQRMGYENQVAFAKRSADECATAKLRNPRSCLEEQAALEQNVRIYGAQTDALGARARPLQSIGGSVHWAQAWLVTLLGIAAVLVAVAMTVAADVEAGRLLPGWHPFHASRRSVVVAAGAGVSAAVIVAAGAVAGSVIAVVVGGRIWPLGSEPRQFVVDGLGRVTASTPSAGWLVAWLGVVAVTCLIGWFAGRTLVAILVGALVFGSLALVGETLPAWVPGSALPATADMWFHHRGEVIHLWMWRMTPLEQGAPSGEWSAISASDPGPAALVGAVIALFAVALAMPRAVRRKLT
jgi:hypothetical protein